MTPVLARLMQRVKVDPGDCWIFQGALTGAGYGQMNIGGRKLYTHRVSYEQLRGPIPAGYQLDHLCRNRACCNPDHLEPVTNAENTRRGIAGQVNRARQMARTHCPRGHAYTGENTCVRRRPDGRTYRTCRTCARDRARTRRTLTSPHMEATA